MAGLTAAMPACSRSSRIEQRFCWKSCGQHRLQLPLHLLHFLGLGLLQFFVALLGALLEVVEAHLQGLRALLQGRLRPSSWRAASSVFFSVLDGVGLGLQLGVDLRGQHLHAGLTTDWPTFDWPKIWPSE